MYSAKLKSLGITEEQYNNLSHDAQRVAENILTSGKEYLIILKNFIDAVISYRRLSDSLEIKPEELKSLAECAAAYVYMKEREADDPDKKKVRLKD